LSEAALLTITSRDFFVEKFGFSVKNRGDYDELLVQSPE